MTLDDLNCFLDGRLTFCYRRLNNFYLDVNELTEAKKLINGMGIWESLWRLEEDFGITDRRPYKYTASGQILGIDRRNNKWVISDDPGYEGPLPSEPRKILIPPDAVGHEFAPGEVSSQICFDYTSIEKEKKARFAEFHAVISGALMRFITEDEVSPSSGGGELYFRE